MPLDIGGRDQLFAPDYRSVNFLQLASILAVATT